MPRRGPCLAARVTDFTILPGKGATGVIDGVPYWLGSHRYLEERRQETPAVHAELERLVEHRAQLLSSSATPNMCAA